MVAEWLLEFWLPYETSQRRPAKTCWIHLQSMNAESKNSATAQRLDSVVIAMYKIGKHLPLALQSVLSHTYPCLEFYVHDNASTDNTRDHVNQLYADSRFLHHYQENQGQVKAKITGIMKSTLISGCPS